MKTAYRRLAVTYHPDKNQGDQVAEEKFKEAAEAYSILSNPEQRARYDRYGHAGVSSSAAGAGGWSTADFGSLEDILGGLFGFGDVFGGSRTRRSSAQRGSDLRFDLDLTLEDAASGKTVQLRIPRLETCDKCGGSGTAEGTHAETCQTCGGAGQVRYQQGFFSVARTCGRCHGNGKIIKMPCPSCGGVGRTEREKSLEVKVPAGVETGTRLRVSGEGEAGVNGGPAGDLYVVVSIAEHEQFERQGSNLYSSVPVTFAQAALGTDVIVRTLDGEQTLKIPVGTQTGSVFRIRSKGMPLLGSRGRGDLFISVTVITPTTLTREQKRLFEQLAQIEDTDFKEQGILNKMRNILG